MSQIDILVEKQLNHVRTVIKIINFAKKTKRKTSIMSQIDV